jgi:hypothetical protein
LSIPAEPYDAERRFFLPTKMTVWPDEVRAERSFRHVDIDFTSPRGPLAAVATEAAESRTRLAGPASRREPGISLVIEELPGIESFLVRGSAPGMTQ